MSWTSNHAITLDEHQPVEMKWFCCYKNVPVMQTLGDRFLKKNETNVPPKLKPTLSSL